MRGVIRVRGRPTKGNAWETAYAQYLTLQQRAGEIQEWAYEPVKLRLSAHGKGGAWYTPDFRVILADGTEEYHEVKGHMRESAAVRIKVAAELHPYTFRLVKKTRTGWAITVI